MEHKFVKIGHIIINLAMIGSMFDAPDLETISIYLIGDADTEAIKLFGENRQRFLAALEKIGYYAA